MLRLANPAANGASALNEDFLLRSAVFAALEKIGSKQKEPRELVNGRQHSIRMLITGEIDDQLFEQSVVSILSIGHAQQRSSSVNPQVPELVAYILGKLNTVTRERILADVPVEFRQNENRLPESSPELLERSKAMLKELRQTKKVIARGPVRCEYSLVEAAEY